MGPFSTFNQQSQLELNKIFIKEDNYYKICLKNYTNIIKFIQGKFNTKFLKVENNDFT